MNTCLPRSKAALAATLDALDVELRPEWQPKDGVTHCNQAVEAALVALEAHIPKGLLANGQGIWLDSADGRAQGQAPTFSLNPPTAPFSVYRFCRSRARDEFQLQ